MLHKRFIDIILTLSFNFIGRLELAFQLWQNGTQYLWIDNIKLIDEIIDFRGNLIVFIHFVHYKSLIEKLKKKLVKKYYHKSTQS